MLLKHLNNQYLKRYTKCFEPLILGYGVKMYILWIIVVYLINIPDVFSATVNVALNKPAFQSVGDSAGKAVDGNTDADNPDTCTFIDTGDVSERAWWYVDLRREFVIDTVTVYNTNDENKFSNLEIFDVLHSSDISSYPPSSPGCRGTEETVPQGGSKTLPCPVTARYIVIVKRTGCSGDCVKSRLTLCEVMVTSLVNDCEQLEDPDNGVVTYEDSVATYSCNTGYRLTGGDRTRECGDDDTWTGSQPQCTVVDCGTLSNPSNGEVTYSSTTYNSEARYSCNAGYVLSGDRTRQCGDAGNWSGQNPQCQAKDCGSLSIDNGSVLYSSGTTFPSEATYRCNAGYDIVGDSKRQCDIDGKWSRSQPQCRAKDCGSLSIDNGSVLYSPGTAFPSEATYHCDAGYVLNGDSTRNCESDGNWSGSQPQCQAKDCGSLSIDNGSVSYSSGTTFPSEATYRCDVGYELNGDSTRQCDSDGDWSGSQPQCQGHCQCDNNECGECELWYVPDRECDVYLKPAALSTTFAPILREVTPTTAVISFKQNTDDVPSGYEDKYYYQLLKRSDNEAFDIWPYSGIVHGYYNKDTTELNRVDGVTLRAKNLNPGTEYTFKYQIYRTHRGFVEKGPTDDSMAITITTVLNTSTLDKSTAAGSSAQSKDTDLVNKSSYFAATALAIIFGLVLLGQIVVAAIIMGRRYYLRHHKNSASQDGNNEKPTITYENIDIGAAELARTPVNDAGDSSYTSLSHETRSPPPDQTSTSVYQELRVKKI